MVVGLKVDIIRSSDTHNIFAHLTYLNIQSCACKKGLSYLAILAIEPLWLQNGSYQGVLILLLKKLGPSRT